MAKYTVTYYIKSGGREHECDMQVEADNAAEACKLVKDIVKEDPGGMLSGLRLRKLATHRGGEHHVYKQNSRRQKQHRRNQGRRAPQESPDIPARACGQARGHRSGHRQECSSAHGIWYRFLLSVEKFGIMNAEFGMNVSRFAGLI